MNKTKRKLVKAKDIKKPDPFKVMAVKAAIKAHVEAIGQHRDALREIVYEVEDVLDSVDDATVDLHVALETLSKYL